MRVVVAPLVLALTLAGETVRAQADAGGSHHRHHRPRDHVTVECPLTLDDPGLVLARVGDAVITACDLAVASAQRTRAGLAGDDRRDLLRGLVDEALLAAEAQARGLNPPAAARLLAEALIRQEAHAAIARRRPDDDDFARYLRDHPDAAVREARVHLRHLVLGTEAEARAAIDALRAGATFEELLPRSIDPLASRDAGDLGLLTREGAAGVPAEVVAAGFAIATDGAVADAPVRSLRAATSRGRRGRREPSSERWHVVQRLGFVPEARLSDGELRDRVTLRILRDRYAAARAEARATLGAEASRRAAGSILEAVLLRVRVRPP